MTDTTDSPPVDLAAIVRGREVIDARAKLAGAEVLRSVLSADPATLPAPVAAARARLLALAGDAAPKVDFGTGAASGE